MTGKAIVVRWLLGQVLVVQSSQTHDPNLGTAAGRGTFHDQ